MQPRILLLAIYLLTLLFGYFLDLLNIRHLKRAAGVPPGFEGRIDPDSLRRAGDYTIENTAFGVLSSVFSNVVLLAFIYSGLLARYNSFIASLGLHFIVSGLVFFLTLYYAVTVLSIPFSLFRSFRIEKKYGFNTMTPSLWVSDFMKSMLISTALTSGALASGLWIIDASPGLWWLWIWLFFFIYSVFMMYVSPYVIEPLFHKFERVKDKALEEKIGALMEKAGIKVNRVFKMDASRRTTHTNAYFTGIGRVKRIVLYDTLLERLSPDEIAAVLAHEAGHWRKRHLLKNLILIESITLAALFIAWLLLGGDVLNRIFGISDGTFFSKAFILGFMGSMAMLPFEPLLHYLSRRHEREADLYACAISGRRDDFISALVKLSADNLSNLHPHPLYVVFHYSHPPAPERIRYIKGFPAD